MNYQDIITLEPGKRSGKPCIRGMRITVYDVLSYLASGKTIETILRSATEIIQQFFQDASIGVLTLYYISREKGVMI